MSEKKTIRSCIRSRAAERKIPCRLHRQICIRMEREDYNRIWGDAKKVRGVIEEAMRESPELFPKAMVQEGYRLTGFLPESQKLPGIKLRQVRVGKVNYTLRPSFVMGYMSGVVDEVQDPLFLLSLGVPEWAITRVFGKNEMYWHRQVERMGRNSLVGTTVSSGKNLPSHLAGDEHHARWCHEKGYVAMTVGNGCILGVGLSSTADEEHLTQAYGDFAAEARLLDDSYEPETVNTDGWTATKNAFLALFPSITVILCFLHGFLKIRDRCRKAYALHTRVWDIYRAPTAEEFSQRLEELLVWIKEDSWSPVVTQAVEKLVKRAAEYQKSYAHPECLRTSNMVDRLMNRLTRYLYAGRGLHGHQRNSELRLRGWALLNNFTHYAPRSNEKRPYLSPAHRINKKVYHPHWLHNLNISASLAGYHKAVT